MKSLIALLMVFTALFMERVEAARSCTWTSSSNEVRLSIPPGNVSAGTRLGEHTMQVRAVCSGVSPTFNMREFEQFAYNGGAFQETNYLVDNASGIGVQYYIRSGPIDKIIYTPETSPLQVHVATTSTRVHDFEVNWRFYKTSRTISPGIYSPYHFRLRIYLQQHNGVGPIPMDSSTIVQTRINLVQTTCNLSNTSLTLDNMSAIQLINQGAGGEKALSSSLSCNGSANVELTLTDASSASNTTNLLTPTGNPTSNGVRLQILRAGNPVTLGSRWGFSAAPGSTHLALSARYVRTTGPLVAGTIGGQARLTLTYR